MRYIALITFLFLLIVSPIITVSANDQTMHYYSSLDDVTVHPAPIEFSGEGDSFVIKEVNWRNPLNELRYILTLGYTRTYGFPPLLVIECLAFLTIVLGAGALTLLTTRGKLPDDPKSRTMILYNTIKEHPGTTLSELQELTGHSRGSVSVNLHRLDLNAKIQKSVRNGTTRYYIASIPEDEINGFLRKVATREKPQKIFETIISTPGISQKELHETTKIPKTTLQWHLAQLAKYEIIKSTRDRNTIHYSVIPDYILLYNHILEEGKQNRKAADGQDPTNSREL